jgi:hypothetical protein
LGEPLAATSDPGEMVLRYLAAFRPATPADVHAWSGLQAAGEILERLRPRLRTFRDEHDRELFDAPRAPLPDPDTPAPVRFLPEYDNVLLAHDDRTRIVSPETKLWTDVGWGHVLVDGYITARWRAFLDEDRARLRIEPSRKLARRERNEAQAEAHRLLAFLADDTTPREVEIV